MQQSHLLLITICIQADPPPKGVGFTDPLAGTLTRSIGDLTAYSFTTNRALRNQSHSNRTTVQGLRP
jgi:hypothetical protein